MALIPWRRRKPKDLMNIRDEIDKLFEDFLDWGREGTELMETKWNPSVDISENDDNIVVNAELPGVKKGDIKVTVRDNVLSIKGEKNQEKEVEEENYHRIERSYGSFSRSFTLPASVESDKVDASYKDGVLKITLPKVEEEKAKEISINVD